MTSLLRALIAVFFATAVYLISGDLFLTAVVAGCVWFYSSAFTRSDRREPPEAP